MSNKIELIMPKMGESIMEGTVLSWLKQEGESMGKWEREIVQKLAFSALAEQRRSRRA